MITREKKVLEKLSFSYRKGSVMCVGLILVVCLDGPRSAQLFDVPVWTRHLSEAALYAVTW